MRVLLTGAFGNVGLSTLRALIEQGHDVAALDLDTPANRKTSQGVDGKVEVVWADLRDPRQVEDAVAGRDAVVHVAAIIPPMADRKPDLARSVNVDGTSHLIAAMETQTPRPRLVFTSSVAVYGDRLDSPLIRPSDPPHPKPGDEYARQKLECEGMIRASDLPWVIFRLTYIASPKRLRMDPLMFEMPLATSIEICHPDDVGLALANTVDADDVCGQTMHIAGGPNCRIIYGEYLDEMMALFGLGRGFLPPEAFSKNGFHCGFMTTDKSCRLGYQRHTLEDYFQEVRQEVAVRRHFLRCLRPVVRWYLLKRSPYCRQRQRGSSHGERPS